MKKFLPKVFMLFAAIMLTRVPGGTQRTVQLMDDFLYTAPDLNASTIPLKESNQTETAVMLDSVKPHLHTYTYEFAALKTIFKTTRPSFFARLKIGDQIGYAHSSQLIEYGIFDYDNTATVKNARLIKLYKYKACTDGEEIVASFELEDHQVVDLPIPFSYFYSIDDCELLYHSFLLNHTFDLSFSAVHSDNVYLCDGLCSWEFCTSIALSKNDAEKYATVKGTKVNIRKGPSTTNDVLAQLNPGDQFLILEIMDEPVTIGNYWGGWVKIRYGDITGWVFSVYVVPL